MINNRSSIFVFTLLAIGLFFILAPSAFANCSPSLGGNHTVSSNCSFSGSVNGVDNGNLTVNSGVTLTVNANQIIAFNAGKSITVNGTIAMSASGAQIKQTNLWILDADNDGYADGTSMLAQDSQPANYQRRNTRADAYDCNDSDGALWQDLLGYTDSDSDTYTVGGSQYICSGASLPGGYAASPSGSDCNDSDGALWQNITGYTDSDSDGYGTGSSQNVCSGSSLAAGYASNGNDCNDGSGVVWTNGYGVDADGDTYGVSTYGCNNGAGNRTATAGQDCNDVYTNIYRVSPVELGGDGDQDGYTQTDSVGVPVGAGCVGNTSVISGRTYYHGGITYDWLAWSDRLLTGGINNYDCDESNASVAKLTYTDGDGDGYGAASACVAVGASGYVNNNTDCNDGSGVVWTNGYGVDADGDTYGVSTYGCNNGAGNRTATAGQDCYDANANAKPGQTSYFATHRGDSSFDYNCNSATDKQYTTNKYCSGSTLITDAYTGPASCAYYGNINVCSSISGDEVNLPCGTVYERGCINSVIYSNSSCTVGPYCAYGGSGFTQACR